LMVGAPQADDVVKILDLPLAIADGVNNRYQLIKRYGFASRQADYYLEACETLGLIERHEGIYALTSDGKKYRQMDPAQQKLTIARKMLATPIAARVLAELIVSEKKTVSREDVEFIIEEYAGIAGTTVGRRAQTMMTWFQWIGEVTGVFSVDAYTIRLVALSTS
jgi:hypothetical protein